MPFSASGAAFGPWDCQKRTQDATLPPGNLHIFNPEAPTFIAAVSGSELATGSASTSSAPEAGPALAAARMEMGEAAADLLSRS